MKKFNKKQLASWINKAVEESSSAYIPFPIADHIAEQLCLERNSVCGVCRYSLN